MKTLQFLIPVLAIAIFSCKKNANDVIDNTPTSTTVKDADENVYNTVKIGNQVWMQENLKTTKFNDGTPITQYKHPMHWLNLNEPQALYTWAGTSNTSKLYPGPLPKDYYGAAYNHFAIESGKLAPIGWRIPTEQDFLTLKNHLTNNGHAGKEATALKSNFGWIAGSGNGTDAVGFRGLPNGYVSAFGGAVSFEGICHWGTSTLGSAISTRKIVSIYKTDTMAILSSTVYLGTGIRCIKE